MLRSVNELKGQVIHARDGELGTIDQFFFDDESWTIRYLVVDTRNWLPGRKVLIAPNWVTGIEVPLISTVLSELRLESG